VDEHAGRVLLVVGISPDVRAPIHHQAVQSALRRETLRKDGARVAAANDEDVARKHEPSSGLLMGTRQEKNRGRARRLEWGGHFLADPDIG
jgi:hypothetical protein